MNKTFRFSKNVATDTEINNLLKNCLEFESGEYIILTEEAPPWLAQTSQENFEKYAL